MDKQTASDVLHDAEERIAVLATDAAKDRDYERAERLLGAARQLAAMANRFIDAVASSATPAESERISSPSGNANEDDGEDDAPVFQRDGAEIVKMGKSRSDEKGYEHKAPKESIERLLHAIRAKSTKSGEFRTSRIFPLLDAEGRKLPAYQGYLCLRWLRQIGLIQRVARQRYQMVDGLDPATCIESAWKSLPQRES